MIAVVDPVSLIGSLRIGGSGTEKKDYNLN